jgi:AraC-like DNA-binding protein
MYLSLQDFIIFFSGVLYLLGAFIYLFEKNKSAAHFTLIGLLFSVGIWQLYHGCMLSGLLLRYPHLALVHVPFLYISAPFLYFFLKIMIGDNLKFTVKSVLHLLPGILFTIMLLPFYMQTESVKMKMIVSPLEHSKNSLEYPFYPVIIFLIIMAISIYAAIFIIRSYPLVRKKELSIKNMTFFSLATIALNYFLIILYLVGFSMIRIYGISYDFYLSVIKIISLIQALQIVLIMIIKSRYPDYFQQISSEGRRIRYATSRIEGIDVQEVLGKLDHLMTEDKVFCDEDLSLAGLAGELSISPSQLSQILNERLKKNFNFFINEYRIKESEKYLIGEPERSVASISYAVGFNTISSFYNAFSKIHNTSPVNFRKNKLK